MAPENWSKSFAIGTEPLANLQDKNPQRSTEKAGSSKEDRIATILGEVPTTSIRERMADAADSQIPPVPAPRAGLQHEISSQALDETTPLARCHLGASEDVSEDPHRRPWHETWETAMRDLHSAESPVPVVFRSVPINYEIQPEIPCTAQVRPRILGMLLS